jgi:hypothetical protein
MKLSTFIHQPIPLIGQLTIISGLIWELYLLNKSIKFYVPYCLIATGSIINFIYYLIQFIIYSAIKISPVTSPMLGEASQTDQRSIYKQKKIRALIISLSYGLFIAGNIILMVHKFDLRCSERPCLYFKLTFVLGYVTRCCAGVTPKRKDNVTSAKAYLLCEGSDVVVLLFNFLLGGFFIVYVFSDTSDVTFLAWIILECFKTIALSANLILLNINNL